MPSAPSDVLAVGSGTAKTITPNLTVFALPSAPAYSLLLVYERFQSGNDTVLPIGGDAWEAQTFAPAAGHTANSLGGRFYRTGVPGTVTLLLYSADDGEGADGGPTGAALGSATFDGDGLTTATTGQWVNLKLASGVALTKDAPYALVVKAPSPAAAAGDSWGTIGSTTYTDSSTVRTYGWRFQVSVASSVTHLTIRAYYTSSYTLHLWRSSDKSLLATKTVNATANTWVSVALDSPVSLSASTDYVVSVNKSAGGNRMARRAAPAAGEFNGLVSFVDGRYSAGADTYPEDTADTNAWGVVGFLFTSTGLSRVYWLADGSSPSYASGQRWYSTNGGTSYTGDSAKDFLFEEGIIQTSPPPAQGITGTGIASAVAFGSAAVTVGAVTISATGIASGIAFGSAAVTTGAVTIAATGIASGVAFGEAVVANAAATQDIAATGIASTAAFGEAAVTPGAVTIAATGIASSVAFGSATVSVGAVTVNGTGIASTAAFGEPAVSVGAVTISATGIASTAAFGEPALTVGAVTINGTGIASAVTFGDAAVSTGSVTVTATGIVSTAAFGTAAVAVGAVTISATGIASGVTFGSAALTVGSVDIAATGIASGAAFGSATVTPGAVSITAQGLASGVTFGDTTVTPGAVTITATGIGSTAALGEPAVTSMVTIRATGIASGVTFGGLVVTTGPVTITATGIGSTVTFGGLHVSHIYTSPTSATVTSKTPTAASVTSKVPTVATLTSSPYTIATVTPPATLATVTSKTPTKVVVK